MKIMTKARQVATMIVVPPTLLLPLACEADKATSDSEAEVQASEVEADVEQKQAAMSDESIAEAVRRELFYDPSVGSDEVKVNVTDGVVDLTGDVTHLLAKKRAAHITSSVKGVRAINNRINVKAIEKDDATLKAQVLATLALDPATDSYDVTVDVNEQVVTLTGSVQSQPEQAWAERAASAISGVKAVQNNINVEYRANRLDSEVQADVAARLRWDNVIGDGLINAKVDNGYVSLSGVVGSLAEKERAVRNAWVNGVKGVEARGLRVEWWAKEEDLRKGKFVKKSDADIKSALKDALLFDPRVNSFTLSVSVSGGVATLQGTVSTLASKHSAEQIAMDTVGVRSVINDIEVDPGSVMDPALETRVQAALERNPIIATPDIVVDVDRGIAKLTGTVNNFTEKAEAEVVAQTVPGIVDVENLLAVSVPLVFAQEIDSFETYPYVAPWASRVASAPLKTDLEMKADIERELEWSPHVGTDSIDVEVNNGVATLTGSVESLRHRSAAEANAYQGGAVKVENKLRLK